MTALCMVPNLEYNACIIVWRGNTSSSIAFFSSAWEDIVTKSPPCLATCSSFAIHSFSAMRKWTLELVASTYTLVALAKAAGCLCTSVTITCSLTCARDVWSSGVGILWDYTTLWWDSSKEMCISTSGWPPRSSVPPWSFKTFSSSGCNEVGESTSLWWGMRSVSYYNSCCSMSESSYWSSCSISWRKSFPCDGSPYSLDANCSDESTTCTGATSSVCTCCTTFCICCCYASLSCFRSSCSFQTLSLSSLTPSVLIPFSSYSSTFVWFACRAARSMPL